MIRNDDDRVNDYFAASSRDWTPASASHAARLLYVPVSLAPEVTQRCKAVLSKTEIQSAERFAEQSEKALFIQRRAFRRYCGAQATGSPQSLSQITFNETEKGRPHLRDAAGFWFGFSSCSNGFIGAWSSTHALGVDLEDPSRDLEARELARQFYSKTEANVVERTGDSQRLSVFYQFWILKEAALKSIGEGLPFGLEVFELELAPDPRITHVPPEHGRPEQFSAHLIKGTDSSAALVIRNLS